MELVQGLEEIGKESLGSIREVFASADSTDDAKTKIKKAEIALKTLGRLNGMQSNAIKERALAFQVAKFAGLKGPEVLAHILPQMLPKLTPTEG